MNTWQATPLYRIRRNTLLLVGATLLGSSAVANSGETEVPTEEALAETSLALPQGMNGFREALAAGNFWVSARYRFENVDQDGFSKQARASTLQTRLGYETGNFNGFTGVLEFSNVSNVSGSSDDYNDDPSGPVGPRPVVADPTGTVVNQVYANYSADMGDFRLGRQRIRLDNARFIGNRVFRQTEQTFDSISYNKEWDAGGRVYYAYLDSVNSSAQTNQNSNSHILNLSNNWENLGRLTAYGYYLDFDQQPMLSTFTYGARFAGDHNMGEWAMIYGLEYALQGDVEDNPNDVDATYSHVNLGVKASGVQAKLGFESLEGSSSTGGAFQTPLANRNAFNGWADQFANGIPTTGLDDTYLDLGYENKTFGLGVIFHQFEPERGSASDYGDEIDAYAKVTLAEDLTIGIQYADFDADSSTTLPGLVDVQKLWIWLTFKF
ncbi:MAG: hypothetical protein ACI8X5_002947 [Planctomycetota bacterium]|jgi:hypothetical protein